jgi:catechol 2,3-dioxygenase-like lactoylglutathione lyase family enzyme
LADSVVDRLPDRPKIIMPAQAIHHINIRARKTLVRELKEFYEGVLGLRAGWRPPFQSTGHWLYLGETPVVHLVEDETVELSAAPRGPNVDHVAFSCTGLRDFEELLRARDIRFRRTKVPETSLVQLIFADPAGNGVELQFVVDDAQA